MKHPVMKIGKFQFHYIQVPYDDRYYVVKYDCFGINEIAKFSPARVNIIDDMIRLAIKNTDGKWKSREAQVDKFFSNKQKYDKYLDNQDEVAFSKLKAKEAKSKKK